MLSDVRVVELAGGTAAMIAALLLGEAGANVTRIEAVPGAIDADPILALRNRGKHILAADPATPEGRDTMAGLLARADILIHDYTPEQARAIGIDAATLEARFPQLIAVAIGAYPAPHAKAEMAVRDSLALGDAGVLYEQAPIGRDGPAYLRLPLGSWTAAYLAAVGASARLLARDRGAGAHAISTSLVQGALTCMTMYWYRAETPSQSLIDGLPKASEASLFECGDGRWIHMLTNADHVPLMKAALDALPEAEREPVPPTTTIRRLFPLLPANRKALMTRPAQEWLNAFWAADIAAQPVLPMGALYSDPQLLEQGMIVERDDPVLGATRQPASPFIVRTSAVTEPQPVPPPRGAGGNRPLEGVKIIDLGNFLAGPFAMLLAADLGADVIKVEATTGDQMRWIDWGFNACQRGKRALALQLKDPRAKPVMERLIAWADVAHHNLRMPAATKLGLSYDALRAINPALIYCHVNSYGTTGPRKDWPGYDQLFQAMSGWEAESGGAGNRPSWLRFGMMDHLCAMSSLQATLNALRNRDRTGEGAFVSASLLGAAAFTAETIALADGGLTPFARLNGAQTGISERDRLYACADGWVAVLAEDDAAWERMIATLDGQPLDMALGRLSAQEAIAFLHHNGCLADIVRERGAAGFFDDPANRACGLVAAYDHPRFGLLEQAGSFWHFGDQPSVMDRAPPVLGQHSDEILAMLDFSPSEIGTLRDAGVVV
jgi:crotonobetainyl-CoA:carnitine CoA-transferase CaiB-like acyl-CoA transferase